MNLTSSEGRDYKLPFVRLHWVGMLGGKAVLMQSIWIYFVELFNHNVNLGLADLNRIRLTRGERGGGLF